MFSTSYMERLPKNRLLAAYQICSDLFEPAGEKVDVNGVKIPRIAVLSDSDISDAVAILRELLEREPGVFFPVVEKVKLSILGAFFSTSKAMRNPWRERNISIIRLINQQLRVKVLVKHVDDLDTNEKELLVRFQAEDVRRINELLSEIRSVIRDNPELSTDHKRRLLRIVSAFQAELDKPKSNFRVFLDGVVEASEALGEAGQKAKPAFDRIREIFDIAERSFGASPQIEDRTPKQLPAPGPTDGEV